MQESALTGRENGAFQSFMREFALLTVVLFPGKTANNGVLWMNRDFFSLIPVVECDLLSNDPSLVESRQ